MNKRISSDELSQQGKARKEAMLDELQRELGAVHQKRRQRRGIAKGVALAVVAMFGLAWSLLAPSSVPENRIADGISNTSPMRFSVASVGNVAGIDDRCVVGNTDHSASIEVMADDELLAMLAAVGHPSVLGEIDGKVRVISDSVPARRRDDAL